MIFTRVLAYSLSLLLLIGALSFLTIALGTTQAPAQFLYVSDDADSDIILYDVNTQIEHNLTRTPLISEVNPQWLPDGGRIVFELGTRGSNTSRTYIMNADGSRRRAISRLASINDREAVWSPDGRYIAYSALAQANFDIRLITLETGRDLRVTSAPARDISPAWSPDSTRLVFTSDRDEQDAEVYVYTLATDSFVPVTDNAVFEYQPRWLDNDRLVYVSSRNGGFSLYLSNVDGSGERNLTEDFFWGAMPSVVDSSTIIFSGQRRFGQFVQIYRLNVDTGTVQRLTDGERNYFYSAWRPF